ncbi:MAG: dihydropteroate synthase [Prevotellaceae bacterium]|jgi:dihydropteroate synthase|nr:dihydropteroate synthase [Prevotellaceae bacterium]
MQIENKKIIEIICGNRKLSKTRPLVMGIINFTPDSFYSQSRAVTEIQISERIETMVSEGADIIDAGAYSSRPGADDVSAAEEIRRLEQGLKILKKIAPDIPVSIDTFRSEVVECIFDKFGYFIVNDISAGEMDDNMFETVAKFRLPYIAMHMKGNPQTMQNNPVYDNLMREIIAYFTEKIKRLRDVGVNDIIIDPGFGFAKTIEQNYKLLNNLKEFKNFGLPLLVGFSRKSMLYKLLNTTPEKSLNATTVVNTVALMNGADILRVHDVRAAVETVEIIEKLKYKNN